MPLPPARTLAKPSSNTVDVFSTNVPFRPPPFLILLTRTARVWLLLVHSARIA